jgi:hypothetical protein
MGLGTQHFGTFAPGFLSGTCLSIAVLAALAFVMRKWTTSWVGEGGRARHDADVAAAAGHEVAAHSVRSAA